MILSEKCFLYLIFRYAETFFNCTLAGLFCSSNDPEISHENLTSCYVKKRIFFNLLQVYKKQTPRIMPTNWFSSALGVWVVIIHNETFCGETYTYWWVIIKNDILDLNMLWLDSSITFICTKQTCNWKSNIYSQKFCISDMFNNLILTTTRN